MICPARTVISFNGFVSMTNILHNVMIIFVSYRHCNINGSNLVCTILYCPTSNDIDRMESSSRRSRRCKSCNQFKQSVTGIIVDGAASFVLVSSEFWIDDDDIVVPITPQTNNNSSTISLLTFIRSYKDRSYATGIDEVDDVNPGAVELAFADDVVIVREDDDSAVVLFGVTTAPLFLELYSSSCSRDSLWESYGGGGVVLLLLSVVAANDDTLAFFDGRGYRSMSCFFVLKRSETLLLLVEVRPNGALVNDFVISNFQTIRGILILPIVMRINSL
jgi:hypothetical protein